MNCVKCGKENPDTSMFCMNCGETLPREGGSCSCFEYDAAQEPLPTPEPGGGYYQPDANDSQWETEPGYGAPLRSMAQSQSYYDLSPRDVPRISTTEGESLAQKAFLFGIIGMLIPFVGIYLGRMAITFSKRAMESGYIGRRADIANTLGIVAIVISICFLMYLFSIGKGFYFVF